MNVPELGSAALRLNAESNSRCRPRHGRIGMVCCACCRTRCATGRLAAVTHGCAAARRTHCRTQVWPRPIDPSRGAIGTRCDAHSRVCWWDSHSSQRGSPKRGTVFYGPPTALNRNIEIRDVPERPVNDLHTTHQLTAAGTGPCHHSNRVCVQRCASCKPVQWNGSARARSCGIVGTPQAYPQAERKQLMETVEVGLPPSGYPPPETCSTSTCS